MFYLSFLSAAYAYSPTSLYEGHQVLTCDVNHKAHGAFRTLVDRDSLDVWGHRSHQLDVRVKNEQEKAAVTSFFESQGLSCSVGIENVAEEFKKEIEDNEQAKRVSDDYFDSYWDLPDVMMWWRTFAEDNGFLYEEFAGTTVEGRKLARLEIVTTAGNPWIYFQCQIHAREWISQPTCAYVISQIVETQDPILEKYNFAIVPVVNPDGYAYTWAGNGDRLWRKNRRSCPTGGNAVGVDLNRNYDDHWGEGGSSNVCSSDTYMGPSPASEFEVQTTSKYFETLAANDGIAAGIDWHSYSQLILRPYGWTTVPPEQDDYFSALGTAYRNAVLSVHNVSYTSQRSNQLYTTTGSASDWFFGAEANAANRIYPCAGFTIELRPANAVPGFRLPPDQIVPTGEENLAGVLAFLNGLEFNVQAKSAT